MSGLPNKRSRDSSHSNHDRWLVSYADFITLLFAFFVVLYATSTANLEKQKIFESSVRTELHIHGEGEGANSTRGQFDSSFDAVDLLQQRGVGSGELADYVNRMLQKKMAAEDLQNNLGDLHYDTDGVRIVLPAASYFNPGSVKIRKSALPSLNAIADVLKNSRRRILIEGHTDDQPVEAPPLNGAAVKPAKAFETNWELAGARASAVVRYLIGSQGFPAELLGAVSYAEQRPLAPNTSEENRAKNRRIEILIVNNQVAPAAVEDQERK